LVTSAAESKEIARTTSGCDARRWKSVSASPPALAETFTVRWVVPPAPVQARVKVRGEVTGPVNPEPESGFKPLQSPEAVQLVALLADQASWERAPLTTKVGLAVKLSVGTGVPPLVTFTVTERCVVPPAPLQARLKVLFAMSDAVCSLPDAALFPAHAPEAVQPVALLADQLNVERPPLATEVGLVLKLTTGAFVTDTRTVRCVVPPVPVQASVKSRVAVSGCVCTLPDVERAPLHAPEAVQLVALLVVQLSVEVPFNTTLVGFAARFTVGAGVEPTVTVVEALEPVPALF
jgi:hypothetical protein